MRRPRLSDNKGRGIKDNSTTGKNHHWMLWSTAGKGRKDKPTNPGKRDSS
jgi:hypothetical protein